MDRKGLDQLVADSVAHHLVSGLQELGYRVFLDAGTDHLALIPSLAAPKVTAIQDAVCERFDIKKAHLLSPRRAAYLARPRQLGMWLAKECTSLSLPAIGCAFNRDHTTVMHALKVCPRFMAADNNYRRAAEELRALFRSSPPKAQAEAA